MSNFLQPKEQTKIAPKEQEIKPEYAKTAPEVRVAPLVEIREQSETPETVPQQEASEAPATAPARVQDDNIEPLGKRVPTPHTKSERLIEIEKIMSQGLEGVYANLDQGAQDKLKIEGEKSANKIERIVEEGGNIAKKILHVLRDWLKRIPGVNKFFLEQESKIKTDRIVAMAKKGSGE